MSHPSPVVDRPALPELLREVRALEIAVRRRVHGAFAGEYRTAFKGSGLEFDEVRSYQPGDDIRAIDWNVSARSTHLFVKIFREERELSVFTLLDVSASQDFTAAGTSKRKASLELAAGVAISAEESGDRFGMAAFSDQVELVARSRRGRRPLLAALTRLLALERQSTGTDLKLALEFFRRLHKRRSLLFVISDFLAPAGYEAALARLHLRHEVILLRTFHPDEPLRATAGILPVVDAESNRTQWVVTGLGGRAMTQPPFAEVDQRLSQLARRYRLDYVTIDCSGDVLLQLERFFLKRNSLRRAN
jgi:uncharacterized protein (DUF58 family)